MRLGLPCWNLPKPGVSRDGSWMLSVAQAENSDDERLARELSEYDDVADSLETQCMESSVNIAPPLPLCHSSPECFANVQALLLRLSEMPKPTTLRRCRQSPGAILISCIACCSQVEIELARASCLSSLRCCCTSNTLPQSLHPELDVAS